MDDRRARVKGYQPNVRQSKTEAPASRNSLTDGAFFPEVRGAQTHAGDAASPATFESRLQESLDSPSPVRKPRRRKKRGRRRPHNDDDDLDVPFASAYEPAPPGDDEAQLMAMLSGITGGPPKPKATRKGARRRAPKPDQAEEDRLMAVLGRAFDV